MLEVAAVREAATPHQTLLVADAMTGQDAVNVAKAFGERAGITGIVLTRVDGDARGGAALSMRAITGKPIVLIGTGEKIDALEPFHPERIAGRILGMGDVVSLVEKAAETVDHDEAEKLAAKLREGQFRSRRPRRASCARSAAWAAWAACSACCPGSARSRSSSTTPISTRRIIKRQEAIISSMTKAERQATRNC